MTNGYEEEKSKYQEEETLLDAVLFDGDEGQRLIEFTYEGNRYGLVIGPAFFTQMNLYGQRPPVMHQLMVFKDE